MFFHVSLLFWFAQIFTSQPLTQPNFPKTIHLQNQRDSLIFKELNEKLASRASLESREKIYLQLDRVLFEPGETVWFAAYVRQAADLAPSQNSQILKVELLDPRGAVLAKKEILASGGTAAGEFDLAAGLPGGIYKIRATTNWSQNFDENFEREITLQKVVLPRLNLKLEFERKAHGAGDEVVARFDAQTLANQALAKTSVKFSAAVEGEKFAAGEAKTDEKGRAFIRFKLPANLDSPDGLLNITLENEGQTEAISRAIPIVLNKIDLQFFPEGGDAVAGLPCRMAFKATNEFGKPADVAGEILDAAGQVVANFSSFHNGMGEFDFSPKLEKYSARLTRPTAVGKPAQVFDLPQILPEGMVLKQNDVQLKSSNLKILEVVASKKQQAFLVGTSQDKVFFFKELQLGRQPQQIAVDIQNLPIGIAKFTLFDAQKVEQAERLVFLHRDRKLDVQFNFDKEKYLPREQVKLNLQVRDHRGEPVAGQFSLAVADENQLTFADDKQGHLLASLLLEQDLRGKIEEPNFYFDTSETKSRAALDLLMLTQGWRRFGWREVFENQAFVAKFQPERAVVSGQVLSVRGKPKKNSWVTLEPGGPSVKTDKEGKFKFENFDITPFTHLSFGDGERFFLSNYGENLRLQSYQTVSAGNFEMWAELGSPQANPVLQGYILDGDTHETLIGATVKILQNGQLVRGAVSNYDGFFRLVLPSGDYDFEVQYTGYQSHRVGNLSLRQGERLNTTTRLASGTVLQEVVIKQYKVPLIQKDATSSGQTISMGGNGGGGRVAKKSAAKTKAPQPVAAKPQMEEEIGQIEAVKENSVGQTLTSETIRNLPTRSVNAIAATAAGVQSIDGQDINIKGSRSNATNYYVDGVRVSGEALEKSAVEEVVIVAPGHTEADKDFLMAARAKIRMDEFPEKKKEDTRNRTHYQNYGQSRKTLVRAREFFAPKYGERVAFDKSSTTERNDFRNTIFWHPKIETDRRGRAEVEFFASDAITNFRATLEGIGSANQPAHSEGKFFVQKPISISAKTPAFVIAGDELRLAVSISNRTGAAASGQLDIAAPANFSLKNQIPDVVEVAGGETKIVEVVFQISTSTLENQQLAIRFRGAEAFEDAIETSIRTLDRGFPVRQVAAGNQDQNLFNFNLNEPVEGTVVAKLTAYPNPLDDILKGMERMLRQPSGCFEQVSSSNYPNLLVLDLLRSTGQIRPDVEQRATQFLKDGYQKLTAYECKKGGFDWYGREPGHEGLTAYGILQFKDMEQVFEVDKKLISRTLDWLESRRDGKGGWQLRGDHLHSWNSEIVGSYLAWAISEAGFSQKFQQEIDAAATVALASDDAYQLALLANVFLKTSDSRGQQFLKKLLEKRAADGSFTGKSRSIVGSTGDCLKIETTALAVLAMLQARVEGEPLQKALQVLVASKNEYGYGSTQSTVLAMKALVNFAKKQNAGEPDGTLVVRVNGQQATELAFSKMDAKPLEINDLGKFFIQKNNQVEVFFKKGKTAIPFDIELKYASRQPKTSVACPLELTANLAVGEAKIGETVRLSAVVKNAGSEVAASPMVIVGIPAGLTLQAWQLKKIVEEKHCDFYELWDGFAVFHFEGLAAGESRVLNLDLRADIGGSFEAPASQAFLYYDNSKRVWAKPAGVRIF